MCKEDDCTRKVLARDMCSKHYMQWRRKNNESKCHCGGPVYAKGLCENHYKKLLKEENPTYAENQRLNSERWKSENREYLNSLKRLRNKEKNPYRFHNRVVSYDHAHRRLRKWRGVARDYSCVDCFGPAAHWSLNKEATHVVYGEDKGCIMAYSLNMEDYSPRCAQCHGKYDQKE